MLVARRNVEICDHRRNAVFEKQTEDIDRIKEIILYTVPANNLYAGICAVSSISIYYSEKGAR